MAKRRGGIQWARLRIPKRGLCAVILLAFLYLPGMSVVRDDATVKLARTLYALGCLESREALLALGTVAMNRSENDEFPGALQQVLDAPGQFARGFRYDERSYEVARELVMGARGLPSEYIYYVKVSLDQEVATEGDVLRVGGYVFSDAPIDN